MTPAQLSWVIDYAPSWLGSLLASVGIAIYVTGAGLNEDDRVAEMYPIRHFSGVLCWGIGATLLTLGAYDANGALTTLLILLIARFTEGIVAVRLYQKLLFALRNRSWPSTAGLGFARKHLFRLFGYFLVLLAGWTITLAVLLGVIETGLGWTLRLYWTTTVATLSIIGLSIKFWAAGEELGLVGIFGAVLLITGAELHNLQTLRLDIIAYLLSVTSYSVGFWYAVSKFLPD